MKNIKLILFLNFFVILISCNKITKPIGEEPLDLYNFNFNTKITELYPNKNRSKEFEGYYNIKTKYDSHIVQKDTTFLDKYSDQKKAVGMEYRQQSSSNIDTLAIFKTQTFNKINIATTLNNEIIVVSAVSDEMSNSKTQNFINLLTGKYGKYKKTQNEFTDNKFFTYEWETNKEIIKYSSVFNDESNTIKIVVDKTENKISQGDKEPHFEGYFYIINKQYQSHIKNFKTGDFVFIN